MPDFLIDSDVMIELLAENSKAVSWFRDQRPKKAGISTLVVMEILQGAKNMREQDILKAQLDNFEICHISDKDSAVALETFEKHHLINGTGIIDSLIAAQAINRNLPLFTFNARHFKKVHGLQFRSPYVREG